ncbi:MAG: hypothetical protein OHK0052_16550 [Anaerolineales bacterium]
MRGIGAQQAGARGTFARRAQIFAGAGKCNRVKVYAERALRRCCQQPFYQQAAAATG